MTALLKLACGLALVVAVVAPPPRAQPPPPHQPTEEELNMTSETMGLEYKNYLEEVVKMLEQDAQFKDILANATDEDIQSGSVADKLHVVDPSIRSKLDELKRIELDRLRRKATEAFELSNGLDRNTIREPHHLDHRNPHTFREEDLRKLIHKTTKDLEELDRQRREDFKRYEMEKEFKYQEQLKTLDEEHKKEAVKKHEEELKKKKEHPKSQVHHPLSEDQLEEVWEEQDHMEREDFNPETFFRMHDVDGNELLDQNEVMALFKTELDKIYNGTDYDPRERDEEMNEMRESTYAEVDTDRDGFISLKEFLASTQHEDYRADQGWEGVNEREMFARQEYEKYEQQRHAEIQRQINMGVMPPPHLGYQPPPGYLGHEGLGTPPIAPQFVPPHAAGQPVPVQGQQQLPAGQQQQQQLPNQNQQFQQPPQQQFQQPPQQQFQQPPQQQFQQPPQQQQQFQQPPQQQFQQSPQQQQYQQPPQQQFQQPPQQPQQQQYQQPPQQQQQQQQYQQQPPQQQQQQYQQPPQQQQQQQQQVPAQKQQQQTGTVNQVPVQTKQ
ncbi:nucleobindin-2-like isoform X1 [Amphibalanus amphitrite]|uniref:nucleobindin-2-like isoform X1 n=1 Tax=Amphibalanus amphitrite TaxID=1232801 RepID=UPI001C91D978|nr:nucleobindin-2-like isoform X1 [Amphibalanus amphitrite]XP_043232077.1 nucleobindin-2-like isoform X1 [Amphibalanus amphitrite]XP_043232087.1 nucleobindin-2-like isoform X1 [Amphibalanus amphitrite]